jgi:hypothetical protein
MNKNTKARLKTAHKNARKGQATTSFVIPQTMQGNSLGERKLAITIGGNTENKKRNMRQTISKNPGDTKTSHEVINKNIPAITSGKVNNRKQEGAGQPKSVKIPA